MSQSSDLAYDISVCVHCDEIASEQATLWSEAGVGLRTLRRFPDGGLRSGMVTLPSGWKSPSQESPVTQQLAILSGVIAFGETTLRANAFAVVPAGATLPAMQVIEPVTAIVILDEAPRAVPDKTREIVIVPDIFAIEPFTPVIDGQPLHGFERRVLWIDPDTGADTRMLRIPAGFRGSGANWHPVNEEIFCLEGDIQPDATRPMRAGSFLWNPARSIHGFEEVTHGGCVLLEWHDGAWDLIRA